MNLILQIERLQRELFELHHAIQEVRARMIPLQEEIELASQEYDVAIRPLYLRCARLEIEITRLQQPSMMDEQRTKDKRSEELEDKTEKQNGTASLHQTTVPVTIQQNQEAINKDQLLEFLVWVLGDQTDTRNRKLLGTLTQMNEKESTKLADMLEQIPSDFYVKPMGDDENNLLKWHIRLSIWHDALNQRLALLQSEEAKQRNGERYDLLQQYRQQRTWPAFLETQRQQYQVRIQQLEEKLRQYSQNTKRL